MWLGDIPVAEIEAGVTPTVYWIHPDQLGRPIAMTDAAGAFVNETTWVAFGGIHAMTGPIGLDLRFPGQWYQHEGGLHYNWHRSYDPTIARYTQPDPLGLVDGPSRYAYVGSDPLQRVDFAGTTANVNDIAPGSSWSVGIGRWSAMSIWDENCRDPKTLLLAGDVIYLCMQLSVSSTKAGDEPWTTYQATYECRDGYIVRLQGFIPFRAPFIADPRR